MLELQLTDADAADLVTWRQALHMRPELAFEEVETAAFVAERLRAMGLEVFEGVAKTGVLARLKGARGPGPVIALRADMDALPLLEGNGFAHVSKNPGRMHACGHDGHMAMLLGAAQALSRTPDFKGEVLFIFQPAEEGYGGGRVMVEEGVLDRFQVERVFGVHNWPALPAGTFGVHAGAVMASTDSFEITIEGKGGHGAMPHMTRDPVVTAAHLITAAQTIVSRTLDPLEAAVVTIATVHAGEAHNAIPTIAKLTGTVRTFKEEVRASVQQRFAEVCRGVGEAFGQTVRLDYQTGYPATVNTPAEADIAARAAAVVVGEENVRRDLAPSMAGEDFAYMLQARPGAYIWLGQGGGPLGCGLHNTNYDFNDSVGPIGARYWVALVKELLG
jgi:amidohydrolase